MKARYINPFTDFGFKKIFGEEASKHLLKDFLNTLLPPASQITELTFHNPDKLGQEVSERSAIIDIYCQNEKGERFIVELQKAEQNYFQNRPHYYSSFPLQELAEKGVWNFNVQAVFCVGILDFVFRDYTSDAEKNKVQHTIHLKDHSDQEIAAKLTHIYLQMPNFRKTEEQLETQLDKWLYFIKNLEDFTEIPGILGEEEIFQQALHHAELAKFTPGEHGSYEHSVKVYRDLKNVVAYAYDQGVISGMEVTREKREILHKMKAKGLEISLISELTGLSEDEIRRS